MEVARAAMRRPILRRRALWGASILAAALVGALACDAPAADWAQWRGPAHNDISPEKSGYPNGWPPTPLWKKNVGTGCTSPVLAGGRLYVMGFHGQERGTGTDTVWCLDARTGAEVWKRSYPSRYHSRLATGDENAYGGPSSTPTVEAATGHLYTLSIDGYLACWNATRGGQPVWAVNLHEAFKIAQRPNVGRGRRDYGHPGSPLVLGNWIVVEVGAAAGTVVAFDKVTGKRAWASESKGSAGHTGGPVPAVLGRTPCLVSLGIDKVLVMRTDRGHEGRAVTEFPWTTDFANNIPTPAVWQNLVVVTSAYNQSHTALLEMAAGGIRQRWRVRDHAGVCSPVIHKGRVFLVNGPAKCLDLATGRRIWSGGLFGDGSCLVTAGDDKVIVFGAGRVAVVDALADTYRELAAVEGLFRATCYPHVALANGILAVKDLKGNLVCLDTSRRATGTAAPKVLEPGRPDASVAQPATPARPQGPSLHDAKAPRMTGTWPGNTDGLVFVWADAKGKNEVRDAAGKVVRTCTVKPRGKATTDERGVMVLGEGGMLAEGVDEALLAACRKAGQLAIEALITPKDLAQEGPARIITFSEDGYHRNFTVAQEGADLLLRLRTPKTGENAMNPQTNLVRLAAGKRHHVIVSYEPGRLVCYVDGRRACDTDRVQGDLGNWGPMHLVFGDEWKDPRLWAGRLEGIAIHNRVIGAEEAARRYELAKKRLAGR